MAGADKTLGVHMPSVKSYDTSMQKKEAMSLSVDEQMCTVVMEARKPCAEEATTLIPDGKQSVTEAFCLVDVSQFAAGSNADESVVSPAMLYQAYARTINHMMSGALHRKLAEKKYRCSHQVRGQTSCIMRREVIQLGSELRLVLGSRRGSKRLNGIETQSGAKLCLDRVTGSLVITGSERSIRAAKQELEYFDGVTVPISAALWAEMMRSRQDQDSDGMLLTLQQAVGCRIHVDRFQQEIRVYGPKKLLPQVHEALEALNQQCSLETIPLPPWIQVPTAIIENIAQEHRVSITAEEDAVVLLGLKAAVKFASVDIQCKVAELTASLPVQRSRTNSRNSVYSISTCASADDGRGQELKIDSPSSVQCGSSVVFAGDDDHVSGHQSSCQGSIVMKMPQASHELAPHSADKFRPSCSSTEDVQFVNLNRAPPGLGQGADFDKCNAEQPQGICYIRSQQGDARSSGRSAIYFR